MSNENDLEAEQLDEVAIAAEHAGLGGIMGLEGVLGVISDRENVSIARLARLTHEDVTDLYQRFIGPAIDAAEALLLEPAIEISQYLGHDNVPVVQIDTGGLAGRLRINLNDAPVWDGDPDVDDFPGSSFASHYAATDMPTPASQLIEQVKDALQLAFEGEAIAACDRIVDILNVRPSQEG